MLAICEKYPFRAKWHELRELLSVGLQLFAGQYQAVTCDVYDVV